MNIPTLPPDKLGHVMYGEGITAVTASISLVVCFYLKMPIAMGIAISIAAGLSADALAMGGKELSDKIINARKAAEGATATHGVEWGDFWAGMFGGAFVALPLVVLDFMVWS